MRFLSRQAKPGSHPPVQISEKQGVRMLHLGGPAVQSAMRIRAPFDLELEYTRAMMAFLLFHPAPLDAALIGLGGGSIAKFIHRNLGQVHLTALEVDPQVVAAARAYFLLPADDDHLEVRVGDGAEYVRQADASLDVLMVDGYDARRIVEDLASLDFYRACHRALRPRGIAVYNLWGSDQHFGTYRSRIATAFDHRLLYLPAEHKGNVIVFAFKPPLPELSFEYLGGRANACQALFGLEFPRFVDRLRSFNPCTPRGFTIASP